VLDPFAGSGTTLVQALESGYDSVGVDIAAFNCLLMRVKTNEHNRFVLERELRDVLRRFESGEGVAGRPTAYVASGSHLRRAATSCASVRSPPTTSTETCCGSYSHARLGPHVGRLISISTFRANRSSSRTGATSTDASASRSSALIISLRRYTLDTLARLKEFARVRTRRSAGRVAR